MITIVNDAETKISPTTVRTIFGNEEGQVVNTFYTSLRTYNGRPFRLEDHLKRLESSAQLMEFEITGRVDEIRRQMATLFDTPSATERFIRITLSAEQTLIQVGRLPETKSPEQGWKVLVKDAVRERVQIKSTDRKNLEEVYEQAKSEGADEALLRNRKTGLITEGSRSNLMLIKDGILYCCDDALPGVTEGVVREIAEHAGIPVQTLQGFTQEQLDTADEILLSKSGSGVSWVKKVGAKKVGQGTRGPISTQIINAFGELVERECPRK